MPLKLERRRLSGLRLTGARVLRLTATFRPDGWYLYSLDCELPAGTDLKELKPLEPTDSKVRLTFTRCAAIQQELRGGLGQAPSLGGFGEVRLGRNEWRKRWSTTPFCGRRGLTFALEGSGSASVFQGFWGTVLLERCEREAGSGLEQASYVSKEDVPEIPLHDGDLLRLKMDWTEQDNPCFCADMIIYPEDQDPGQSIRLFFLRPRMVRAEVAAQQDSRPEVDSIEPLAAGDERVPKDEPSHQGTGNQVEAYYLDFFEWGSVTVLCEGVKALSLGEGGAT